MVGSGEKSVILGTVMLGILKVIVSAPGFALASRIACRKEPAPLLLVFLTVKVACAWVIATVTRLGFDRNTTKSDSASVFNLMASTATAALSVSSCAVISLSDDSFWFLLLTASASAITSI